MQNLHICLCVCVFVNTHIQSYFISLRKNTLCQSVDLTWLLSNIV